MNKIKAVHFGAGKIGRGLIAQIYKQNNLDIVFIDNDLDNLEKFEKFKKYDINFFEKNKPIRIDNFNLLSTNNETVIIELLRNSTIISTSIGTKNLPFLVKLFAKMFKDFELEHHVQIICFENGHRVSSDFKKQIEKITKIEKVNFLDVVIDRIVPEQKNENWSISTESEYEIIADKKQHNSELLLTLEGIKYSENLNSYINRKLILVNAIHTLIGLLGWKFGYHFIEESLNDDKILDIIRNYQKEAINALLAEHPEEFNIKELREYAEKSFERFKNPFLKDTNLRVIKNPISKMKNSERFMSVFNLALKHNLKHNYLLIPFSLLTNLEIPNDLESEELQTSIKILGLKNTLHKFTALSEEAIQKLLNIESENQNDR